MKLKLKHRPVISPVEFAERLIDPETSAPFVLYPEQRRFLQEAVRRDADGRLLYPLLIFSAPKKSGKTALDAMFHLYTICVLGGRFAEGECFANDLEQSSGRVFQAIARIVSATPWLAREANITNSKIPSSSPQASRTRVRRRLTDPAPG